MSQIQDLSNLGQSKEGKILNLRFPSPSPNPLTIKEFAEFSIFNFDQVGKILKDILEFLKGQSNVNEVYKQRLKTIETILDAWIKEAKKLEKPNK
jgi:hypothetical protein